MKYPTLGIDATFGFSVHIVKYGGVLVQNTQLEIGINSDGTVRAITIDPFLTVVELGRSTSPDW